MKVPSVYVIIVNWNGISDTSECLASLEKIHQKKVTLEVVVVDNYSSDGSVEAIKGKFPRVHVIPLLENLGFSGGNNKGIAYALEKNADFIWLLNNDTVVDADVLSAIDAFEDPNVAGVGSKIYFYKGSEFHKNHYSEKDKGSVLWYAGGVIDWKNMLAFHRGVDEVDVGQYDKKEQTDFITGCSFFIRADVMKQIGYLDEAYFMYMEDLDLSLRIQHGGFKTMYNPASVLWHKNASSSGGSGSSMHEYYQTRNRLKIGMKYAPMRTRVALIREGLNVILTGSPVRKKAVIDWVMGKMGKQYEK